ncbi:MAG: hypothetical protein ACR2HS_03185 [Gammaproteobacteria bacterium]
MIEREDVAHLFKDFGLLQIEVDHRHIELMDYVYALGIKAGQARAKAAVEWRINGSLWAEFIEENLCP